MASLAPFRPDLGELESGTPTNAFMIGDGYGPRPTLSAAPGAAALAAAPRGVFGAFLPDGTFKGFGATATNVYSLGADYTWTSLLGSLTVPSGYDIDMSQFGVFMVATDVTDGMYAYNMASPAGLNAVSGAPAARYCFPANNQLVALGNGSGNLNRLSVSAFGDLTNWTTKGASRQDMNVGGAFTGGDVVGNGFAVLLQQRGVKRMTFGEAGGGALFRLDDLATDVGCVHPRAQVAYNGVIYFLHTDGFYACDGNGAPVNIGANKVNKWFLARCSDLTTVYAAVDPKNTIVRFRYKGPGVGSTSVWNDILDYNWTTQEFIPGTETTAAILRMGTPGYTLNTLSSSFGTLNAWSQFPLDSSFWEGGNLRLAGLDGNLKFGFFDGPSAVATIETNTEGDGLSYLVTHCEPLTDDPATTVELGVKDTLSGSITWKAAQSLQPSGRAALRGRGKYQRYRLNHASGAVWTKDSGVAGLEKRAGGPR